MRCGCCRVRSHRVLQLGLCFRVETDLFGVRSHLHPVEGFESVHTLDGADVDLIDPTENIRLEIRFEPRGVLFGIHRLDEARVDGHQILQREPGEFLFDFLSFGSQVNIVTLPLGICQSQRQTSGSVSGKGVAAKYLTIA